MPCATLGPRCVVRNQVECACVVDSRQGGLGALDRSHIQVVFALV